MGSPEEEGLLHKIHTMLCPTLQSLGDTIGTSTPAGRDPGPGLNQSFHQVGFYTLVTSSKCSWK